MDGWMAAHCDIIAPQDLAPPAVKMGGGELLLNVYTSVLVLIFKKMHVRLFISSRFPLIDVEIFCSTK